MALIIIIIGNTEQNGLLSLSATSSPGDDIQTLDGCLASFRRYHQFTTSFETMRAYTDEIYVIENDKISRIFDKEDGLGNRPKNAG